MGFPVVVVLNRFMFISALFVLVVFPGPLRVLRRVEGRQDVTRIWVRGSCHFTMFRVFWAVEHLGVGNVLGTCLERVESRGAGLWPEGRRGPYGRFTEPDPGPEHHELLAQGPPDLVAGQLRRPGWRPHHWRGAHVPRPRI